MFLKRLVEQRSWGGVGNIRIGKCQMENLQYVGKHDFVL